MNYLFKFKNKKIKIKSCRSPHFRVLTQPLPSITITWSPTQFGLHKTYYQIITMTCIYEMYSNHTSKSIMGPQIKNKLQNSVTSSKNLYVCMYDLLHFNTGAMAATVGQFR